MRAATNPIEKAYLWCDLCHPGKIHSMDGERSEVHVKDNLGLCLDQRRKQEDCVLPHPLAGVVIEEWARTVVVTFPPMSMCWENHNAIAFWHDIGVWHTGDTNQTWKQSYLNLKNEHMENNTALQGLRFMTPPWPCLQNNWDKFLPTILSFKSSNHWEICGNPQNHRISEWEGTWNVTFLIVTWLIR